MEKLYEARKNAYSAPMAELILASEQIRADAHKPWEFKSLAQKGAEEFILYSSLYDHDKWLELAQKELARYVSSYIYYEDKEGLLFFVRNEGETYRVARSGDASYDFVRRLNAEHSVDNLRFTKPPTWAEELFLGRENLEAYELIWHDNSSVSNPRYETSKKLLADAVIRETKRRMGSIPGLPSHADRNDFPEEKPVITAELINLVALSKAIALHFEMRVGEACDWLTKTLLAKPVAIFNISGMTLPTPLGMGENGHKAVIASFNTNWWDDPRLESESMPGSRTSANEVAIKKADAVTILGIPADKLGAVEVTAVQKTDNKVDGDKPLTTTERNTLLTIIAALCDYSDIKYQERGAAKQIVSMTQEIGAPVSDDTIRSVLTRIPDAVESRKK